MTQDSEQADARPEAAAPAEEPDQSEGSAEWRRWRRLTVRGALVVVGLLAALVLFELVRWPRVSALVDRNPESTAFLERARERLRDEGRPEPRIDWVPRSRISRHLQHAVVVSEDIGFFGHEGFDFAEIKIVVEETLSEGKRLRGASTLTQQLAKNLWLSPSRNPIRKLKEVILTRQLESELTKQRILEIYLNVVEMGDGIYGAETAARHYWGISAANLSRRQAAELAALLPSPRRWRPGSESRAYRTRVEIVLERMEQAQWVLAYL